MSASRIALKQGKIAYRSDMGQFYPPTSERSSKFYLPKRKGSFPSRSTLVRTESPSESAGEAPQDPLVVVLRNSFPNRMYMSVLSMMSPSSTPMDRRADLWGTIVSRHPKLCYPRSEDHPGFMLDNGLFASMRSTSSGGSIIGCPMSPVPVAGIGPGLCGGVRHSNSECPGRSPRTLLRSQWRLDPLSSL